MKSDGLIVFALTLALALGATQRALARGCLAGGTRVSTPSGPMAVERLGVGDVVWSVAGSGLCRANVVACYQVIAERMLTIRAAGRSVRTTPEHPFETSPGTFTEARYLRAGDTVWLWQGDRPTAVPIDAIEASTVHEFAYNLMVSPGGCYLAEGILVHNKGCFLPDTPILKADGVAIPISAVRVGDRVRAFDSDGALTTATVEAVLTHQVEEYCQLTTDGVILNVTAEHPFFVGRGTFKTLAALRIGDVLFACDGESLTPQRVVSLRRISARVTVYNLQTDEPHTFFANGIAVHNKGGGGHGGGHSGGHSFGRHSSGTHLYGTSRSRGYNYNGHYYSGGSSGGNTTQPSGQSQRWDAWLLGEGCFFAMLLWVGLAFSRRSTAGPRDPISPAGGGRGPRSMSGGGFAGARSDDLEFIHGPDGVALKAAQTERLMSFLLAKDASLNPAALKEQVASNFVKLQQCWEARDYEPMRPLLMPDLFHSHAMQLAAMVRQHEINHLSGLIVERVDLVHLRYPIRPEQREFTALMTGTARDYFTDDRTGEYIRGDASPCRFQEFWIFHFLGGRWLLREIEQSRESEALWEKNSVEGMSDAEIVAVGGAMESGSFPTTRPSKVEALLQSLAARDPARWDRSLLMSRARRLFVEAMLAEETGAISTELGDDALPCAIDQLRSLIGAHQANGESIAYRNLCVRKVEVILARDGLAASRRECVTRVVAHAQKIATRGDSQPQGDPYEVPFVKFLTLEWADGKWKLKEIQAAL